MRMLRRDKMVALIQRENPELRAAHSYSVWLAPRVYILNN
jgi:hypothetical protein